MKEQVRLPSALLHISFNKSNKFNVVSSIEHNNSHVFLCLFI